MLTLWRAAFNAALENHSRGVVAHNRSQQQQKDAKTCRAGFWREHLKVGVDMSWSFPSVLLGTNFRGVEEITGGPGTMFSVFFFAA